MDYSQNSKIIRTATEAKGGITDEEKKKLDEHAQLWIKRIMRTEPINPEKIIPAIKKLYSVSGLKEPRVVIVPSPFVGRIASGIASAIWYQRKHGRQNVATRAAMYAATDAATATATDAATRAATYEATDAATDEATDVATRAAMYAATDVATRAAMYAATDTATRDATYEATYVATRDATIDAMSAATDVATRAAMYAATDVATRAATYEATDVATRAATYEATDVATRAATKKTSWLHALLKVLTPESIDFSIGCIKLSWKLYQGGNMWGQQDSYLTAFRDVIGLQLPIYEKYEAWEQCAIEGGFRYMHEEFCMVSDFPEILLKDENNQPHCSTGPSHRWRDGFEIYHLHGIRFEKELFLKVISGTMPFAEILAIEDIDQRTQAMRFGDVSQFLAHVKAEKLDTYIKTSEFVQKPIEYALYRIPKGDLFTEDAYYMVYTCPSTNKRYMSGVPEFKTVAEAMSWKLGDNETTVTPEDFMSMVPLVHES